MALDKSIDQLQGLRGMESSRLDRKMTPRKKNRAHERLMAFLNRAGHYVSATALVNRKGEQIDFAQMEEKQDLMLKELKQLNKTLEFFIETL